MNYVECLSLRGPSALWSGSFLNRIDALRLRKEIINHHSRHIKSQLRESGESAGHVHLKEINFPSRPENHIHAT